jgi:hypothetical protein
MPNLLAALRGRLWAVGCAVARRNNFAKLFFCKATHSLH